MTHLLPPAQASSDVFSGISVGLGHTKWYVSNALHETYDSLLSLFGRQSTKGAIRPRGSGLKVVGVGYGRTGTYSLALAMEELGFPTLHTQHLYQNDRILTHLVQTVFYPSIIKNETIMGSPNFELLVDAGFAATMDLPFALYHDRVHELYPDCKFVLTVRENSEVWFKSWNVMTSSIIQPAMYTSFMFSHVKKLEYYMRWLFSVVNNNNTYLTHPFPVPPKNKQKSISSYENHNQSVRSSIPSTHLLEYNVREGWDPLCQFLEIPTFACPSAQGLPIPKTNSAREVQV